MRPAHRSWTVTGAVQHHVAVLVLLVAITAALAAGAAAVRPPTYEATALLFLDGRSNASQGFDLAVQAGQLLSSHYIQIATSEPVLAGACETLRTGGDACSPEAISGQVSAATVKGTSMIAINGRDRDPRRAAALANAVADAVIKQNRTEVEALVKPTATYLDAQLKTLGDQIAQRQSEVAQYSQDLTANGRAQAANAQSQLTVLQGQFAAAYQRKQDLVLSQYQMQDALSLYQRASLPSKPIDPNPVLYISAGILAGILIGLAAVILLERFDDRVFGIEDLIQATGSPLGLSMPASGTDADVRYYALARAHVLAQRPDLRRLVVVAAGDRDQPESVALGIGSVAARAGQSVLVLARGGRSMRPPVGSPVPHVNGNGHDLVRPGRRPRPKSVAEKTLSPGLDVAPLSDDGPVHGFGILGLNHDLTIFSAPPPHSNAAGIYAARSAELAVVVATARSTTFIEAQRTAEALQRAGVPVAASILLGAPPAGYSESVALHAEVLSPVTPAELPPLPSWRGPRLD